MDHPGGLHHGQYYHPDRKVRWCLCLWALGGIQSQEQKMYSTPDSADLGQAKVYIDNDKIRVYYDFGEEKKLWVPEVMTKKVYEEMLLPALSSSEKRRIGRFYPLYSKDDKPEDYNSKLKKYPVLEKEALYIMTDELPERFYEEIYNYMVEIGYEKEQYLEDMKSLGIEVAEGEASPGFKIPVEYKLDNDGFSAKVLTSMITDKNDSYHLTDIALLSGFNTGIDTENSYYLVPDGSGALINLFDNKSGSFSKVLYGYDYTVQKNQFSQVAQNAIFPVFAQAHSTNGFFAIVQTGDEACTLLANKKGSNLSNNIYAQFNVCATDVSVTGESLRIKPYNLYANGYIKAEPEVKYVLTPEHTQSYSAMANYYRDYLTKKGDIEKKKAQGSIPLYIDFSGVYEKKDSFLGIPYNNKIVLSTLSGINSALDYLYEQGITNVNIRLNDYTKNGQQLNAGTKLGLYSRVGSLKELEALADKLEDKGNTVYIDKTVLLSDKHSFFGSFYSQRDASKRLNRTIGIKHTYDLVIRKPEESINSQYLVSPKKYEQYAQSFLNSLPEIKGMGISESYAGQILFSDFNSEKAYTRSDAAAELEKVLEQYSKDNSVITNTGNFYTLKYSDAFLNMPLTSSSYLVQDAQVPFCQMVLHGSIDYAGNAVNTAKEPKYMILKSVESGASLYYSCIEKKDGELINTDFEKYISATPFDNSKQEISELYKKYNEALSVTYGQYIKAHEYINEFVTKTLYENSVCVIVNYSSQTVNVDGTEIAGMDFAVIKGYNN